MLASTNRTRLVSQLEEIEKASYESGHIDGYLKAMQLVRDFIDSKIMDVGLRLPEEEKAKPKNTISVNGSRRKTTAPYVKRAVQYVKEHPGVTAREAAEHVGGRYILYLVRQMGLIEKRGKQFYPLNAGS